LLPSVWCIFTVIGDIRRLPAVAWAKADDQRFAVRFGEVVFSQPALLPLQLSA